MQKQNKDFSDYFESFRDWLEPLGTPEKGFKYQVFLSIDTEWVQETARKNRCLSYQIAGVMLDPHDESIKTCQVIKLIANDNRLALADLLKMGLDALDADLNKIDLLIHVIAHHFTAEWSMLSDRKDPDLLKQLTIVRKTLITAGKRIEYNFPGITSVEVMIHDTILLAPATAKSLERLSSLLEDDQKIHLTQKQKSRMDLLLEDDPELFKKYALKDAEVTLKLFFLIQDTLNKIVEGKYLRKFKTLGSSAVTAFLSYLRDYQKEHKLESAFWHPILTPFFRPEKKKKDDEKKLSQKTVMKLQNAFKAAESLVKSCYHGGKNESYFLGETFENPHCPYNLVKTDIIKNKVYLDIDLQGAYPSAMASIPLPDPYKLPRIENGVTRCFIDFKKLKKSSVVDIESDIIPVLGKIQDTTTQKLQSLSTIEVPHRLIKLIKFNLYSDLKKYRAFKKTVTINQDTNNKLIDRWYRRRENYESEHIPGFAKVRFKFPEGTQFPSLPVSHVAYGLIYPLEGETCCTAIEVVLAMEIINEGNRRLEMAYKDNHELLLSKRGSIEALQSVEFETLKQDGKSLIPLQDFFASMLKLRKEYKALKKIEGREKEGEIMQTMVKEIVNSFYGKFAQSINFKKSFDIATGINKRLPYSQVTNPYFAALTTGLVRASLCSMLHSIEKRNRNQPEIMQYLPISCTTDGMLIGFPKPTNNGFKVSNILNEEDFQKILQELNQSDFYDELLQFLPNKQMKNSRSAMNEPEYLEVKHVVEEVVNVKTRGQIGFIKVTDEIKAKVHEISPELDNIWEYGIAKVIARFGHRVPLSEIYTSETYEYLMTPKEDHQEDQLRFDVRKTADAYWLMKAYENEDDEIQFYPTSAPVSLTKIIRSEEEYDLVWLHNEKKINSDYDWKRKVIRVENNTGDPYTQWFSQKTEPFKEMKSFLKFRKTMDQIRKSRNKNNIKSPGLKARPDLIYTRLDKPPGRIRKNQADLTVRTFLAGLLQDQIGSFQKTDSYKIMAEELNKIFKYNDIDVSLNLNHFKNAKRAVWQKNTITKNKTNDFIVHLLCEYYQMQFQDVEQRLYKFSVPEKDLMILNAIMQAFKAVINADRLKIGAFSDLSGVEDKNKEALIQFILDNNIHVGLDYSVLLKNEQWLKGLNSDFKRFQVPKNATTRKYLIEFLKIFDKDSKKIDNCLKLLFRKDKTNHNSKNPALKSCLIQFVRAIYQKQIVGADQVIQRNLLEKLRRFGLHNTLYYRERDKRFLAGSIKNTPKNKKTIVAFLNALNLPELKTQAFSVLIE